ncbi:MAG TPA: carbohydrate porin [Azospirillaceae bacterium]|nr:carbohydrate porin [Azospirillaceae bacterium]
MRSWGCVAAVLGVVAAGLPRPGVAAADPPLQGFGYLRATLGATEGGGPHACWQLPGAPAKFRLGNECDVYGEIGARARLGDAGGPRLVGNLRYGYFAPESDADGGDPFLAEAWGGVAGLLPGAQSDAMVWGGRRFYRRQDLHLLDFKHWDASGDGAGVEDLDLGPARAAYAWFRAAERVATPAGPARRVVKRHDLRLYGIAANAGGTLGIGGDARTVSANRPGTAGRGGAMLSLTHDQAGLPGGAANRLALQAGRGAAATLNRVSDPVSGGRAWRVVDELTWVAGTPWTGQVTAVAEWREGRGRVPGQAWYSLGARPVYAVTEHVSLAVEAGVDLVDPDDGPVRRLAKLTLAPTLAAGPGFYDRPQLRAFATYARWNAAARRAGLRGPDGGRDGLSVGIQVETWW